MVLFVILEIPYAHILLWLRITDSNFYHFSRKEVSKCVAEKSCCLKSYLLLVDYSYFCTTLCTGIDFDGLSYYDHHYCKILPCSRKQICLCPLPSVEEIWHQRPLTSAFLWKLQRIGKDGRPN